MEGENKQMITKTETSNILDKKASSTSGEKSSENTDQYDIIDNQGANDESLTNNNENDLELFPEYFPESTIEPFQSDHSGDLATALRARLTADWNINDEIAQLEDGTSTTAVSQPADSPNATNSTETADVNKPTPRTSGSEQGNPESENKATEIELNGTTENTKDKKPKTPSVAASKASNVLDDEPDTGTINATSAEEPNKSTESIGTSGNITENNNTIPTIGDNSHGTTTAESSSSQMSAETDNSLSGDNISETESAYATSDSSVRALDPAETDADNTASASGPRDVAETYNSNAVATSVQATKQEVVGTEWLSAVPAASESAVNISFVLHADDTLTDRWPSTTVTVEQTEFADGPIQPPVHSGERHGSSAPPSVPPGSPDGFRPYSETPQFSDGSRPTPAPSATPAPATPAPVPPPLPPPTATAPCSGDWHTKTVGDLIAMGVPDIRIPRCVTTWGACEVRGWLGSLGLQQYAETLLSNNITGRRLCLLTSSNLPRMGITDWQHICTITAAAHHLLSTDDYVRYEQTYDKPAPGNMTRALYLQTARPSGRPPPSSAGYQEFLRREGFLDVLLERTNRRIVEIRQPDTNELFHEITVVTSQTGSAGTPASAEPRPDTPASVSSRDSADHTSPSAHTPQSCGSIAPISSSGECPSVPSVQSSNSSDSSIPPSAQSIQS